MKQESHDHNFKNLLLDFPEESLKVFYPQALEHWGNIQKVEFVRQEPGKYRLSDSSLALDMPILYTFKTQQLLLWLVEFQEDKSKFSIYKLSHYAIDMMEAYPEAVVVPTVLFTDRKKWQKDVLRKLESKINNRLFIYFEYVFIKLFDLNARDYYDSDNPVVKILLPKMNYEKHERPEVIRQAYLGLYKLTTNMLFEKYIDFIDVYAQIQPDERDSLYNEIIQHKETAMLSQFIKNIGKKEGRKEGKKEGKKEGNLQTARENIIDALQIRFGEISSEITNRINKFDDPVKLKKLFKRAIQIQEMDEGVFFA